MSDNELEQEEDYDYDQDYDVLGFNDRLSCGCCSCCGCDCPVFCDACEEHHSWMYDCQEMAELLKDSGEESDQGEE